jgi:hypothetical protein
LIAILLVHCFQFDCAGEKGALKNVVITTEHFRALYNNLSFEHFVYDARKVNRLRQFATSNTLQILVINIDAFRKNFTGTEERQKSNVIYKESDQFSGRQPIEFVQAARPIVIIDEPQSVDRTDKAQQAIKALNRLVDEWVTQLLRQGDSQVFKRYSQMKREALEKINRQANEMPLNPTLDSGTVMVQ